MTLNEQFHGFLENHSIESAFNQMAQYVFEHCYLVANETKYFLTEIEFYYHANGHKDEFCKQQDKQLENDTLFFHYSGVDITFGSSSNEYGGILIRGIASENKKEEKNGPLRVLCTLLNKNTQDKGLHLKLVVSSKQERTYWNGEILQAARIGLSVKAPSENEKKDFVDKKYRYFIKGATPKPKDYSKGKPID